MRFTKLVSIGMIAGMAMALSGCFDSTPKCDDKAVKELVGKLAREAMIKPIDNVINETSSQIKSLDTAFNGANFYSSLIEGALKQAKQNKEAIENATLELENFMTESIDKDIKKTTCKVHMTIKYKDKEDKKAVLYSVQNTDSGTYVEIQGFE